MTSTAVRRYRAENYILTSLIAFAVTVIVTRLFLELTGYPQIGNSVLHIAHALWGGLLLVIAFMLPLAYANRWVLRVSALLGGVGIGLFIDEVGKFITQTNDYFYPPAMPLIYGFILLITLVYFFFRRPRQENPREALYSALEGLKDALDVDLDASKAARIETHLAVAMQSDREEIQLLAQALNAYLRQGKGHIKAGKPGFWRRASLWLDEVGVRLGRRRHRTIISIALIGWVILVTSYITIIVQGGANLDPQVHQWRIPLIVIQGVVGILMVVALIFWLSKYEVLGMTFGVSGFLISFVALQLLYFYISQFLAITVTLLQLVILQVLLAYRRWYLSGGD